MRGRGDDDVIAPKPPPLCNLFILRALLCAGSFLRLGPPQKERKRAVPPKSTPDNEKQARSKKKSQGKTVQHLRATQVVIVRTRMTTFAQSPFSFSLSSIKEKFPLSRGYFLRSRKLSCWKGLLHFFTWAKQSGPRTVRGGMGRTRLGPNSKKNLKSGRKRLGIGFQISM